MAKVYTESVAIPGGRIDEYFRLIKAEEEKRAPFRQKLKDLQAAFLDHLMGKFSERTANKHAGVIELFIEFICKNTDVEDISEITRGMVCTHFQKWWDRKVLDPSTPDKRRVALKKFFLFLASEKGIVNEKVIKALDQVKSDKAEPR